MRAWRSIAFALCILALFTALGFGAGALYGDRAAQAMQEMAAAAAGALQSPQPDAAGQAIDAMAKAAPADVQRGLPIVARYGYGDAGAPFESIRRFEGEAKTYGALLGLLLGCICAGVYIFNRLRQRAAMNRLCHYLQEIVDGRDTLALPENNESERSILQNQIYKTTVALHQYSMQLQRDKLALADSLSDISHQIKTPLTSLFVLCDLIEDAPEAQRLDFLQRMRAQLHRIEWMVKALLKMARLDAGAAGLKREHVEVDALIDRALAPMRTPMELKQQTLKLWGEKGLSFDGDFVWTAEALANILKNCVEHTPPGGRISVAYHRNPLYVEIVIADNGVGIDEQDLPNIFTRFYRGKNASDDSVGIGLAMAKAIIEQQGGSIEVRSIPGKGATFVVRLYAGAV